MKTYSFQVVVEPDEDAEGAPGVACTLPGAGEARWTEDDLKRLKLLR